MSDPVKRTIVRLSAFFLLGTAATVFAQKSPAPVAPPPVATAAERSLLQDAIDIHAHLDPDSAGPYSVQAPRRLDVIDMAHRAKRVGMRGFVIKQHYDQTAQLAYIASKVVPGVEVFGQLCLNLTVGGLNPAAVYHFAEVKGGRARIVSMPTWDAQNNVQHSADPNKPFVSVARDGALLPETKAVIKAIAGAHVRDSDVPLALATGHLSPEEALLVVREARAQGIARIVVTHAIGHPVDMTVAQMQQAVAMGAVIELVGAFVVSSRELRDIDQYVEAIRVLGADHLILSSDGGQQNRAYPDDMIAHVAGQLRAKGISAGELRKMMVDNPAKLLGISQHPKS